MAHEGPVAIDIPDPHDPDWDELAKAKTEAAFMHASVELFKEAATLAATVAGLYSPAPLQRDAAIRTGLLVRAARLARTTLRDTCDGDGEQQLALFRQLMDTVATVLYLSGDEDGTRHQAYVQNSLVAERESLKTIAAQQKRNGGTLPIEDRMKRSMERLASVAGVDLDSLPGRKGIGWPTAEELVEQFGPTAYPAYRMGSASLHGTWLDIHRNYLDDVDGGFRPRFEPLTPRPQPLLSGARLLVTATQAQLAVRHADERTLLAPRLHDLTARLRKVDELHEALVQRRSSKDQEGDDDA